MGSRTCLGANISKLEMSKIVPQIVRGFDLELTTPGEELKGSNFWFVRPINFFCRVAERTKGGGGTTTTTT